MEGKEKWEKRGKKEKKGEWMNGFLSHCIHAMEYYAAVKRNTYKNKDKSHKHKAEKKKQDAKDRSV